MFHNVQPLKPSRNFHCLSSVLSAFKLLTKLAISNYITASFILKYFVSGIFVYGIIGVYQNCLLSKMIFKVFYLVENAVAFLTLFESCIKICFLVLCVGVVSFCHFLSFFMF